MAFYYIFVDLSPARQQEIRTKSPSLQLITNCFDDIYTNGGTSESFSRNKRLLLTYAYNYPANPAYRRVLGTYQETSYMYLSFLVGITDRYDSLFHIHFMLTFECCSTVIRREIHQYHDSLFFRVSSSTTQSLQELIDITCARTRVRHTMCRECLQPVQIVKDIITCPLLLYIFLEQETALLGSYPLFQYITHSHINLTDINRQIHSYRIVAVVYVNQARDHFMTRFLKDGIFFDYDGMINRMQYVNYVRCNRIDAALFQTKLRLKDPSGVEINWNAHNIILLKE